MTLLWRERRRKGGFGMVLELELFLLFIRYHDYIYFYLWHLFSLISGFDRMGRWWLRMRWEGGNIFFKKQNSEDDDGRINDSDAEVMTTYLSLHVLGNTRDMIYTTTYIWKRREYTISLCRVKALLASLAGYYPHLRFFYYSFTGEVRRWVWNHQKAATLLKIVALETLLCTSGAKE